MRNEQAEQLKRVTSKQGGAVLSFLEMRLRTSQRFFAAELHDFVAARIGPTAPASCDRVMRELRAKRHCEVLCINRSMSLYEVRRVKP